MLESLQSIILINGEPCMVRKPNVPDELSTNKYAIPVFEVFEVFDVHYCGSVLRGGNFTGFSDTLFIVDGVPYSFENSPKVVLEQYFSLHGVWEKMALFSILLSMYVEGDGI